MSLRLAAFAVAMLAAAWPAAAQPKPSFDCARVVSTLDRLICADDELATLDRELGGQYRHMRHGMSVDGLAVLRRSQTRWLAGRITCLDPPGGPDRRDAAIVCLKQQYQDRAEMLRSQYARVGDLALEAREVVRSVPRLQVTETDTYPVLMGRPPVPVAAFNAYVSRRLELAKGMFAASGIKLDPKPTGETSFSRSYEIHRFDARLISIEVFQSHESYFGHGWRSEYAINWDLQRAAPLHVADLFKPDEDWRQGLLDFAVKSLRDQAEMADAEGLVRREDIEDDEAWVFDAEGAVLLLGRNERSMAGASAEASVPYEVLARYLKPEGPVGR